MDKPFFLPFVNKEQLTSDAFTFFFKRDGNERDFVPGQTYEMKLPHKSMDERGDSRVFTISSSPTNKDFITITTRIIQSTFKFELSNLKPGQNVQFEGPWDDLNFDPNNKDPHVFLAGGIGVTPFHSILQYVIDKNIETQMILFVSWKNSEEMVFDDFFRAANNRLENFSYVPTVTDERLTSGQWDGELGRIDQKLIEKYVLEIGHAKYFLAGPPAMVGSLKQTVLDMGVPKENLLSEEFEGY